MVLIFYAHFPHVVNQYYYDYYYYYYYRGYQYNDIFYYKCRLQYREIVVYGDKGVLF